MIVFENFAEYNIARAVYSARNAMNSWVKSDSDIFADVLGAKDLRLAQNLYVAGTDHSKFMRQIFVTVDILAPLYWWKEADTYKVGTVSNSCSTMHKLMTRELSLADFSFDNMTKESLMLLEHIIEEINRMMFQYHAEHDVQKKKQIWESIIRLLPESYNQRRTLTLNYAVLANMIESRKHHKLREWQNFCMYMLTECQYLQRIMSGKER